MAQTFPPGKTNRNTGVSRPRSKFLIRRRDNHALGVTLGRYTVFTIYNPSIPFESFNRESWMLDYICVLSLTSTRAQISWKGQLFAMMYLSALWVSAIRNCTFVTFPAMVFLQSYMIMLGGCLPETETKEWVKFLASNFWPYKKAF